MSTLHKGFIILLSGLFTLLLPIMAFAVDSHQINEQTANSMPVMLVVAGAILAFGITKVTASQHYKRENVELREIIKVRSHELEEKSEEQKKLRHNLNDLQKKFDDLVTHDELTGTQNRHGFDETFGVVQGIVNRYARPFSILMFEVDNFRTINKTHGAGVGDKVLKAVTTAIVDLLRTSDSVYRFADKEFMVILPETPIDHAFIAAERVRMTVSKVFVPPVTDHTLSIGVAEIMESEEFTTLFKRVNEAMNKARESGGNTIFRAKYE